MAGFTDSLTEVDDRSARQVTTTYNRTADTSLGELLQGAGTVLSGAATVGQEHYAEKAKADVATEVDFDAVQFEVERENALRESKVTFDKINKIPNESRRMMLHAISKTKLHNKYKGSTDVIDKEYHKRIGTMNPALEASRLRDKQITDQQELDRKLYEQEYDKYLPIVGQRFTNGQPDNDKTIAAGRAMEQDLQGVVAMNTAGAAAGGQTKGASLPIRDTMYGKIEEFSGKAVNIVQGRVDQLVAMYNDPNTPQANKTELAENILKSLREIPQQMRAQFPKLRKSELDAAMQQANRRFDSIMAGFNLTKEDLSVSKQLENMDTAMKTYDAKVERIKSDVIIGNETVSMLTALGGLEIDEDALNLMKKGAVDATLEFRKVAAEQARQVKSIQRPDQSDAAIADMMNVIMQGKTPKGPGAAHLGRSVSKALPTDTPENTAAVGASKEAEVVAKYDPKSASKILEENVTPDTINKIKAIRKQNPDQAKEIHKGLVKQADLVMDTQIKTVNEEAIALGATVHIDTHTGIVTVEGADKGEAIHDEVRKINTTMEQLFMLREFGNEDWAMKGKLEYKQDYLGLRLMDSSVADTPQSKWRAIREQGVKNRERKGVPQRGTLSERITGGGPIGDAVRGMGETFGFDGKGSGVGSNILDTEQPTQNYSDKSFTDMIGRSLEDRARGLRNNNPLNIELGDDWEGKVSDAEQTDDRFVQFDKPEMGIRAAAKVLATYKSKGIDTLSETISRWAPANENDTANYIEFVSEESGIEPDEKIDLTDERTLLSILRPMIKMETGSIPYPNKLIRRGIQAAGGSERQGNFSPDEIQGGAGEDDLTGPSEALMNAKPQKKPTFEDKVSQVLLNAKPQKKPTPDRDRRVLKETPELLSEMDKDPLLMLGLEFTDKIEYIPDSKFAKNARGEAFPEEQRVEIKESLKGTPIGKNTVKHELKHMAIHNLVFGLKDTEGKPLIDRTVFEDTPHFNNRKYGTPKVHNENDVEEWFIRNMALLSSDIPDEIMEEKNRFIVSALSEPGWEPDMIQKNPDAITWFTSILDSAEKRAKVDSVQHFSGEVPKKVWEISDEMYDEYELRKTKSQQLSEEDYIEWVMKRIEDKVTWAGNEDMLGEE